MCKRDPGADEAERNILRSAATPENNPESGLKWLILQDFDPFKGFAKSPVSGYNMSYFTPTGFRLGKYPLNSS
jgi:hypothetical protein